MGGPGENEARRDGKNLRKKVRRKRAQRESSVPNENEGPKFYVPSSARLGVKTGASLAPPADNASRPDVNFIPNTLKQCLSSLWAASAGPTRRKTRGRPGNEEKLALPSANCGNAYFFIFSRATAPAPRATGERGCGKMKSYSG